ncbi:ionic transporter [Roseiarcaceae bacterium H3SJ34-1]|uniref:calcium:proton antiporter n=1 Tax=Terripilifer ovatus TaxID=3032367 RepID=UPI003AB951C2|nr:ionic transporter [Roseiarcaceae bacterium H3SJ34-1]
MSSRRKAMRIILPVFALALAGAMHFGGPLEPLPARIALVCLAAVTLVVTVFVVVHHAEAVAQRIGEPYGTLLLTFAVTTIEVSVIVSMMLKGANNPSLARESVFSTVMIVCTGLVGICLTLGGWRHQYQDIKRQGTSAFLAVLIALSVLTLILPDYTLATKPGTFSTAQLIFVSALSVLLYGAFVFAQTDRHRDDFVFHVETEDGTGEIATSASASIALLATGLVGVVLLAELVASEVERGLIAFHVPQVDAVIGALIALLVLMPEGVAAIRAALSNELQRSLNVALGSACATIGLTIPAVAVASLVTGRDLDLGLGQGDTVLLVLALTISVVSFSTGKTTVLTGLVHLVVFVAYLLLVIVP